MGDFVGAIVQITLREPAGRLVQGRVKDVLPGKLLYLQDVFFPESGISWPEWAVENWMMADLEIIKSNAQPSKTLPLRSASPQVTTNLPLRSAPPQVSLPPQQARPTSHTDPAILSYERSPGALHSDQNVIPTKPPATQATGTTINLQHVFATNEQEQTQQQKKKKQKHAKPIAEAVVLSTEVSRNGNDMNGAAKRGKGWRQTPLLQPAEGSKKRRRQRQVDGEAQNGWATEDATDVQNMDEFDFEANLKLFDKEQVFEQLRKDDTTADEDRLVSHNKLPRKNLLPTEMVLSPKLVDGSDADTEVDFNTGRSSSRQSKRQGSRTNSGYLESRPHPLTASVSSERAPSRASRKGRPLPATAATSLKASEHSPASRKSRSAEPLGAHFVIGNSRRFCPVLLPQALQTLEDAAIARYGISADAVAELAARCVAEETLRLINDPNDVRRPSRSNTARGGLSISTTIDSQRVVVILAGNHGTGARALAAVRHLISRKYKVIIAEGVFEAAAVHDLQYATQHQAVKKAMREGANIKRGGWKKANAYIKSLTGPPVAIIDALFAGTTYDDLLGSTEELSATALEDSRQMIDWANRSRAPVISITIPSGVSGLDGSAAIVDGEPLAIRPDKLLALGTPVTGVLEAIKGGESWDTSVADIGINIALKADDAVDFGSSWVSSIHLDSA